MRECVKVRVRGGGGGGEEGRDEWSAKEEAREEFSRIKKRGAMEQTKRRGRRAGERVEQTQRGGGRGGVVANEKGATRRTRVVEGRALPTRVGPNSAELHGLRCQTSRCCARQRCAAHVKMQSPLPLEPLGRVRDVELDACRANAASNLGVILSRGKASQRARDDLRVVRRAREEDRHRRRRGAVGDDRVACGLWLWKGAGRNPKGIFVKSGNSKATAATTEFEHARSTQ